MTFSAESWSSEREAFVFRCVDARRGDRWTFCVSRGVLESLSKPEPLAPQATFDMWRVRIYAAASSRMLSGDPTSQQAITVEDIRRAS